MYSQLKPAGAQADPSGVPYDGSTAPAWFAARPNVGDCGDVVLDVNQGLPDVTMRRCLARPEGAELGVGRHTDEGDVIVTYYRRGQHSRGADVITDATRDAFGQRVWSSERCEQFSAWTLVATGCHRTR